jgi:hypothetical protein
MRALCRVLVPVLLLLPILARSARADEARLRCVADTSVSSYSGETEMNYGQASRIRLKGIQMLALFQFDTAPVKGWKVDSATLYLRYAGSDRKLRTLGFSTISAPWTEGTGAGEKKPGETCFAWREQGKTRWAGPDTDFTDVSYTAGNTIDSYADIEDKGDGWFAARVDPRIVQAMLAGASYGLAVSDEKGQTMANNDVYSREQSNSQPYLVITGHPVPPQPPAAIRDLAVAPDPTGADFDHGAVEVSLTAPEGAFTYRVEVLGAIDPNWSVPEWAVPLATPGKPQRFRIAGLPPGAHLDRVTVRAISATGNPGPPAQVPARVSAAKVKPAPLDLMPKIGDGYIGVREHNTGLSVRVYADTEKAHPLTGKLLEQPAGPVVALTGWARLFAARGETVAFNLLVESPAAQTHGISITPPAELTGPGSAIRPAFSLYRDWYVKDGDWYPEACIPLTGPFDIPAVDNKVPGQKNQSILVELLVPKAAKPGRYTGNLLVSANGKTDRVPLTLEVNSLAMPDTLSFDVSLNTYGTMGHLFGIDDRTEEYRKLEREYHRMAHAHRATLAPLGYSHSGTITSNYAPPLAGDGADLRITDWSRWDAQFGPYLDGSAFKGLPRDGVPITHLYTPFHEAWPVDITRHYHYTPTTRDYPAAITEHALKAPPIEQAMDAGMAAGFVSVVKQWAAHMKEKGWTKTRQQFYQNDKHYYKDPKMGGRGTSWWLLDEPNYRDDWLALAYFGRLFREGMKPFPDVPIVHREDISRPQWQRDYLDGLVDLMVVSGELYNKGPRLKEMKEKLGVKFWNYGEANPISQTNLTAEAWAIRAWLAGADAIVPWQSVGTDENYEKPDPTALLLPGKRFGITGPIATLRLKALRRAQQDVEYLVQLAARKGWDREQTAVAISGLLKLQGVFEQTNSDDAGRYRFGPLRAADFDALRRAIGGQLVN